MKKQILFFAVAALALASCSSENDVVQSPDVQQNSEPRVVMFDAYTQRATTRAGETGIMNIDLLKTSGFGVFGFYTNNSDYDPQSVPNFFYNQKIEWKNSNWAYEPVKYWPNEYGENAESDDFDRVSYFAYAPYVESVPSTGKIVKGTSGSDEDKWGITGMTRNSAMGDPIIKYIASFDQSKAVDLVWGVCDDPLWSIVQDGSKQKINDAESGLPWLNVYRPMETDNQRVKFTFKHALSQLSVNVDAFIDGYNNSKQLNADETRIFIRSISFTGFAMKGALNLNNTEKNKAYWLDYNGTADLETGEVVTIYDGRKDGKEGAAGSIATNEKMLGLNPQFVQDVEWYSAPGVVNSDMAAGVTNVPATLFRKYNEATKKYEKSTEPALVIPTGEQMEVEIVYDIETVDKNLSGYVSDGSTLGSSIENRIKKSVNFGENGMENGKHYTLNLHLGLNSVKFDAEVSDWVEAAITPDVDLPSNMPSFTASATAANNVNVDWDYATATATTKYYFYAIDGFNGGEAVSKGTPSGCSVTINSKPDFTGTEDQANASGVAYVRVQIAAANDDVLNKVNAASATVTGGVSTKKHTINITQLARPLSMRVSAINNAGTMITLERWDGTSAINLAAATNWQVSSTGASPDDYSFTILKNGVKMEVGTTPAPGQYKLGGQTATTQVVILGTPAVGGDIYTITVKTGDAAEETVVAKIGGISYTPGTREITYQTAAQDPEKPTYYGPGAPTYSWSEKTDANNIVSVDANKIKTDKAGTGAVIKATLTAPTVVDAKKENWYFLSTEAEYSLDVNKQAATVSFSDKTKAVNISGTGEIAGCLGAILTGEKDGVLAVDAKSEGDATIGYSFVGTSTGFAFDTTVPYKVKNESATAGTYDLTIKATVTDGTAYTYAVKEATYTLKVTVE